MAVSFPNKGTYTIDDLRELMAILRSADGCPWDREQTHESIRSDFLEETYEAVEAIDSRDTAALREELGDVLLQVVFHARIEEETGGFTFDDVVTELCRKLIQRHPHVFGDRRADDAAAVLQTWDAVKRASHGENTTQTDLLRHLPRALPALMRAQKVQGRARRVGYDRPDCGGALQAAQQSLDALRQAAQGGDTDRAQQALGNCLFELARVARWLHLDAEQALSRATDEFTDRFGRLEALAAAQSVDMTAADTAALDALWQAAREDGAAD